MKLGAFRHQTKFIWTIVHEICDTIREKKFCREILLWISVTLWSLSDMVGFTFESYVPCIIYLFSMIQMVALFNLKF